MGDRAALSPAIRALRRIEARLDRPLRLAVVGEFNSGKSSLANLLARTETLPTAVVSNTRIPTLLCYAREPEIWAVDERGRREWLRADQRTLPRSIFRLEVGLPAERLRAVQILDLPGIADPKFHDPGIDAEVHDVARCNVVHRQHPGVEGKRENGLAQPAGAAASARAAGGDPCRPAARPPRRRQAAAAFARRGEARCFRMSCWSRPWMHWR